MKKKLLSLLLAVCIICSTLVTMSATAFATNDSDASNGLNATKIAEAIAEGEDVLVASPADLAAISAYGQKNTFADVTIKLIADIDATGITWTTIPTFEGIFDGDGNTISNLNATVFDSLKGTLQNVTFKDSKWTSPSTVTYAGMIANKMAEGGKLSGVTMKNCTVTVNTNTGAMVGQVASSDVVFENCQVLDGKIEFTGKAKYIAPFVSYANASFTLSNCFNSASVSGGAPAGMVGFVNLSVSLTIRNCVNRGDVTTAEGHASGFVNMVADNADSVVITNCVNMGDVTAKSSGNAGAGGFIGSRRNATATLTDCVNLGTMTGHRQAGFVGFLVGEEDITLTNCISAGTINGTNQANSAAFFTSDATARTSTITSCYYPWTIFPAGSTANCAAVNLWVMPGVAAGTFVVKYPAAGVDFPFLTGTDGYNKEIVGSTATYKQEQNRDQINAMFTGADNAYIPASTNYKTGAMVTNASSLYGVDGAAFLTKAGFDFGTDWYITGGMPVPTALALENQTLDTEANIVYKGYQAKLVNGEATTASIRLVAGLQSREFVNVGYELSAVDAGKTLTLNDQTTNVVYTSLRAYTEDGVESTPVTAESCKCAFLSAITVNDLPTDRNVSLVIKPFVTDASGNRLYGSSVVLAIKDGEVVAQYTF